MTGNAKTILVVDDEPALVRSMEVALKKSGYRVYVAANGSEGFAKAIKLKPKLILLDILMPKLSGIEMLKKLRECTDGYCRDVSVIILTNLTDALVEEQVRGLGCTKYIVKSDISLVFKE